MGGIYWFVFIKNLQPDEAYGALYLRRVFRCPFLHLGYGVDALNRAFMEILFPIFIFFLTSSLKKCVFYN